MCVFAYCAPIWGWGGGISQGRQLLSFRPVKFYDPVENSKQRNHKCVIVPVCARFGPCLCIYNPKEEEEEEEGGIFFQIYFQEEEEEEVLNGTCST